MMAESIGTGWNKKDILYVLLRNPRLQQYHPMAYRDWILLGSDLDLPIHQLREIKKAAKANPTGLLYETVGQVISIWYDQKTQQGKTPSVLKLISALKHNDLCDFADDLEFAIKTKNMELATACLRLTVKPSLVVSASTENE